MDRSKFLLLFSFIHGPRENLSQLRLVSIRRRLQAKREKFFVSLFSFMRAALSLFTSTIYKILFTNRLLFSFQNYSQNKLDLCFVELRNYSFLSWVKKTEFIEPGFIRPGWIKSLFLCLTMSIPSVEN